MRLLVELLPLVVAVIVRRTRLPKVDRGAVFVRLLVNVVVVNKVRLRGKVVAFRRWRHKPVAGKDVEDEAKAVQLAVERVKLFPPFPRPRVAVLVAL